MSYGTNGDLYERNKKLALAYQQQIVNDEIEAESDKKDTSGDTGRFVAFMAVVIMIKPVAEYCIGLYGDLATQ